MAINTWTGRPVNEVKINYENLSNDNLPTFSREPFTVNGIESPYLDSIIHSNGTPIATVSKTYALVQHTEAINIVSEALINIGYNPKDALCELITTELGERIWIRIRFPQLEFDSRRRAPKTTRTQYSELRRPIPCIRILNRLVPNGL